ncbi:Glycerophosphoryl diester phosphodiesterase [Cinnamomum micranthum f. kanehirae]|uniref:glycerophosphodiester phosphodiesterase n=1 Tax=Cinnamomum micranthum f. kanehirae TaxID=337451 RepID=A0A3S4NF08_9MAGN|nr:Glycerophosphoryl diester phosphodiesterase [Cinnamomum micranthum f. kanehirae]
MPIFRFFLLFLLSFSFHRSEAQNTTKWRTLAGNSPVVIAKGGFSGLLPGSSYNAYALAMLTSLPDVILWCDVQLTKDGFGICAPDVKLDNCTSITLVFNGRKMTYLVDGVPTEGYFSMDFTLKELSNVFLTQGIYSRTYRFDSSANTINTVEYVAQQLKPSGFWLNIQHNQFFNQHNLSMRSFVVSVSKRVIINYISSPEVGFLKSIGARFKTSRTKLIFRFRGTDDIEPSTNQTYGSLLNNLTFIKTFASGILIPKYYIWPMDANNYLLPHTSVVLDAHNGELEVYASDFVNDALLSYNYSYDPLAESLNYIDNGDFSVDGILTDFPITHSEAIGCFAHMNKNGSKDAKPVIISHNGASGIYPGSTDLAYQQAVDDGADIIDCSVQMTSDGMPVCLGTINLVDSTTVIKSSFNDRLSSIPEINGGASGVFTFNLTWNEFQALKPKIVNPFPVSNLDRNPAYANAGNFMTLANFLMFAKDKPITGILIIIENAAFLAEKLGLSVTDSVMDALKKAGYDNQTSPTVTIQSTNSSVLNKFKQQTKYKLMYMLDESIRGALNSSIEDIKRSADSVAIGKTSIYPINKAFTEGSTDLVARLHSFGLEVYAYLFRNEFLSQAWDFFSDPTVEINAYFQGAGVDGIITEFPATVSRYRRNPCLNMGKQKPSFMDPVQPGGLLQLMTLANLPPTQAPLPILTDSDVEEPPLPAVSTNSPSNNTGGNSMSPTSPRGNGQPRNTGACIVMSLMMLLGSFLLI